MCIRRTDMIPLKNGVVLWSDEYQNYFRADVYRLEGYGWLFRVNNQCFSSYDDEPDFKVREIDAWFDSNLECAGHGTMLVKGLDCDSEHFDNYYTNI
jgi:hypothetical protein